VPTREAHIIRARQNEAFARTLNLEDSLKVDWAITILFYSALHYVDAYFAIKPLHPPNHEQRDAAIARNPSLDPIWPDYRRLKDRSEAARYEIANFHKSDFAAIDQKFLKIKAHLISKL
jgi:hypothetical protein